MTGVSNRQLDLLLSAYLDNEISPQDKMYIETLLAASPEVGKRYEELAALRQALSQTPSLPPNNDFYNALDRRLPRPVYRSGQETVLQRKFFPAFAGAGALAFALIVLFTVFRFGDIKQIFTETSHNVQQAYEQNVVNGWLMPLFNKTGKDEALQYAMFGVLPLDDSSQTVLRIDNSTEKGYVFEIGQGNHPKHRSITVDDLYSEIQPTEAQRQALDTIFLLASKQIEEGVLLDQEENLAISPMVIDLQQSLLAKVAASLDVDRRKKMGRFFEACNAAYTVRPSERPAVPRAVLVRQLTERSGDNNYLLLSKDTILYSRLKIDRTQVREQMEQFAAQRKSYQAEYDQWARNMARQLEEEARVEAEMGRMVRTGGGSEIRISTNGSEVRIQMYLAPDEMPVDNQRFVATFVEPRRPGAGSVYAVQRRGTLAPGEAPAGVPQWQPRDMDSIVLFYERQVQQMERELESIDTENGFHIMLNSKNIFIRIDSIMNSINLRFDSTGMNIPKLRRLNELNSQPEPPGVEIRPDYYEYEQRDAQPGSPYFQINQYKERLNRYKHSLREYRSEIGKLPSGMGPAKPKQKKQ